MPSDPELARRIEKLAEWARTRGPAFEDVMREKQGSNAAFAFLGPQGEGRAYYLHCRDGPSGAAVPMPPAQTGAATLATAAGVGAAPNPAALAAAIPPHLAERCSVGLMASSVLAMRLPRGYCAVTLPATAAKPAPMEPGRLLARLEEFYEAVDRDADELVERQVEARRFTGGRPRSRSKSAERSRGSSDGRRRRRDRSRSRERSSRSHRSSHDFEHRY